MVDLGNRLKTLRTGKHMTQRQLAQLIGVTKSMVSAYETAIRYPSYDILIRLASVLAYRRIICWGWRTAGALMRKG